MSLLSAKLWSRLAGQSMASGCKTADVGEFRALTRVATAMNTLPAAPCGQRMALSQLRLGGGSPVRTSARHAQSNVRSAFQRPRFHFSRARRSEEQLKGKKEVEALTISARFKKMSREYGWAAVGVYLGLSVLDFPFCFLLVRTVGTDKIAEAENWITSRIKAVIPEKVKSGWRDYKQALKQAENEAMGDNDLSQHVEMIGWGIEEAEEKSQEEGASLATQLALAYAIHKSFIFVRVPLTAAILPKVVRLLRGWGWRIGKRRGKR